MRRASALILSLAILLVAGCSGQTQAPKQTAAPSTASQSTTAPAPAPQTTTPPTPPPTPITLKIADTLPESHLITEHGTRFLMKRVEELTKGQVKFQFFPNGQIGSAKDMLKLATTGVTDIAYIGPAYVGTMPLSSVAEMPGAFSTSVEGTAAFMKLVNGFLLEKEYLKNGVRPIYAVALPPYEIWNTKRAVKSLDDAKGLKIRTAGGSMDLTLKAIGATPVAKPPAEIYEAIQRGVMDGSVAASISLKAYKMEELIKFGTVGTNLGTFVFTFSISETVWQKLPKNVQDALSQAGAEAASNLAVVFDQSTAQLNKEIEGLGIQLYRLTPEQKKQWSDVVKPVWEEWAKAQDAKGQPGTQAVAEFQKILGR